jgi:hypothetical protein
MKRSARLEQIDIELAIAKALKEVNETMVMGTGSWKLMRADKPGEKDSVAFICDIVKVDHVKESPETMIEVPNA